MPFPFRLPGRQTKIFDPEDGFGSIGNVVSVADPSVAKRGSQWWMFLAGQLIGDSSIHLFSACLPDGMALSATGWKLVEDCSRPDEVAVLTGRGGMKYWDNAGGRHCPAYVRGWDPSRKCWVERIYYAGSSSAVWGPYSISYIEKDGEEWLVQPEPVFVATEPWERGSVYEPNVIYANGKWRLWYVAGSNHENYLAHGYAESDDGRGNWSRRTQFAHPDERVFDFCPIAGVRDSQAVYARVYLLAGEPPANTGLWWCQASQFEAALSSCGKPVQIMTAENRTWHAGPWKPSAVYSERGSLFIFFNGAYPKAVTSGLPVEFTVGCLELDAMSENANPV